MPHLHGSPGAPRTASKNYMHFQAPSTTTSVDSQTAYVNTTSASHYRSMAYAVPSTFTAANAMRQPCSTTLSPLQTHFDPSHTSTNQHSSTVSDNLRAPLSTPVSSSTSSDQVPYGRPDTGVRTRTDSHSQIPKKSSGGRRRNSESVEVGSARDIYLEKNRRAASKCRNKQKRQQEDLVEEVREKERRNKLLKGEVEMLRGGLHELMEIVGQHANCPDSRLTLYVQREADRLAVAISQKHFYSHSSMAPGDYVFQSLEAIPLPNP
ncbi:hypothetical protein CC86DRAFT_373929 [Ophiobolus disseminans]|uniref:BZIP domain-containing protein n=1 Tax=Ophiobolus disseminans TaxID=1469910 RepID=A0A6A6ZJ14_9PLEO|nr:hypothetical protein CC86DRAFT_373929 [Ophiobolus disseminans]